MTMTSILASLNPWQRELRPHKLTRSQSDSTSLQSSSFSIHWTTLPPRDASRPGNWPSKVIEDKVTGTVAFCVAGTRLVERLLWSIRTSIKLESFDWPDLCKQRWSDHSGGHRRSVVVACLLNPGA